MTKTITVQVTLALQQAFTSDPTLRMGLGPFCEAFKDWKSSGEAGEYEHYLFGKDAAYIAPSVNGLPYLLHHVHIVPFADIDALTKWDKSYARKSRKVSDRALIYVRDDRGNYLLLFILPEPIAHEVATMKTAEHRELMLGFAHVAGEFLISGKILA